MSAGAAARGEGSLSIAFSSFRLDRRSGQLTRAGTSVPLRAKTWAVLLYLAERPGVLVTREELLDAVWPGVAVTPDTLTKSIGELRRALGDESTTPRFIETVHRRGVRFIANTSEAPAINSAPVAWVSGDTRPVVGRAAEHQQLADRLAKACAGERQIVFVTGPAGVGKTTLVETFLHSPTVQTAVPSVRIGRGACVEQHGPREPFMPVLESLERLARQFDAGRLEGLLRRVAPTWLAQMPWLVGDDAEALRHSLQAARAERMLREFAALTEALATDVTMVLALEDLHWSDPSTVDLLSLLGQRREPARLLVIGTYRPAEIAVQEHALSRAVRTLQVRRQCVELPVHEPPRWTWGAICTHASRRSAPSPAGGGGAQAHGREPAVRHGGRRAHALARLDPRHLAGLGVHRLAARDRPRGARRCPAHHRHAVRSPRAGGPEPAPGRERRRRRVRRPGDCSASRLDPR
jgi:DNA-binding winged helix-turn-helix (wHTH) protein